MKVGDRVQVMSYCSYTGMYGVIKSINDQDIDCKMEDNGTILRFRERELKVVNCIPKKVDSKYHDSHYQKLAVQPIEVMQMVLTPEEFIGFLKGNIIKYSMRAGLKDGEETEKEIDKVARYFEWLKTKVNGGVISVK